MNLQSLWIAVVLFLSSKYQRCSLANPTNSLIKLTNYTKVSVAVIEPIHQPFHIDNNPVTTLKGNNPERQQITQTSLKLGYHHTQHKHRIRRAIHQISLSDPLDCLSQIICGLNTYPPQVPSVRTKTANDFAYLLKNVIIRLKKQELPDINMKTKIKPSAKKSNGKKSKEEQNDYESEEDDDTDLDLNTDKEDSKGSEEVVVEKEKSSEKDDIVRLKDLYPPIGFFNHRIGRSNKANKINKARTTGTNSQKKLKPMRNSSSPLERLRMETDIRQKLRSDARCILGILDHTCPFKYQELMVLTSGVLERQRTVSYTTNKILPLVGYLLKSRSLTETLKATFTALERINNITLTKDAKKEPISFSHVYDEILNGELGDIGIKIVETRNYVASSNVWEDDEFDESLNNPFVQRKRTPGYVISDRNKPKAPQEDDASDSEEPKANRPNLEADNIFDEIFPNESPEADENESNDEQESEESDLPLPQLYGIKRT